MKYKVGDKVRVRQWDDMAKEFGINAVGSIQKEKNGESFVYLMREFCGKEIKIEKVGSEGYIANGWRWQDWMFEKDSQLLLENIESRISYRYLMLGDKGYEFPNSYEGDLIKLMNEYIEALRDGK